MGTEAHRILEVSGIRDTLSSNPSIYWSEVFKPAYILSLEIQMNTSGDENGNRMAAVILRLHLGWM